MLRVLLFASLRDRAGWGEKMIKLPADGMTAGKVWDQLRLGSLGSIRIAVNQKLVMPDQPVLEGDELAFLPPFSGG